MKRFKTHIALIFFILTPVMDCFGQLTCKVDERMELTSIVFRVAGIEEFTNDNIPEYAKAIDSWFGKYKSHKLIDLIKEMRKEHGLGFAGVAASVPFLVIDENGVHDSELRTGSEIEGRWTDENWEEYVRLLDDFYHKSRFHKFFISQQELYDNAIRTMDSYLAKIDTTWFRSFFGEYEEPVVYAAIANGYNNYCFDDPTLYHDGYGIAIGYTGGYPNDVVLHEMCHRYTLISDEYYPQVEEAMRRIFETSDLVDIFLRNRYGSPKTVFNEWLTDLAAALYMKEHYGIHLLKVDATYLGYAYGYIWTPRAAQFMDNFYANRDIYPYFKDFMPRICEFMNYTTSMDNWMKVIEENDTEKPYIVNTYPVERTCLADYGRIDEVRVTFSEPMNTKAIGFKASFPVNDNPFDTFGAYWKDSITLIIPLFENAEIKDTTYMIRFNNSYIQSIGSLESLDPDNSQIVYEQKKNNMKISKYVFLFDNKDKYFVYSSLSNSLIEIDDEAYVFLKNLQESKKETDLADLDETARDLLIQNRIVTENDEDDFLMFKASITQLRAQRESMHLTLAPTMQCCFNCPYCFEKGKGGEAMPSSVMDAIVKFVISHKELQELNLTWFGGEPLMAVRQIEEFYDKLMEQLPENVKFSSNIITSGYHLDTNAVEILKKAKVTSIQITLDGLRETHNKIKNFPGCGDVFEKVIGNIEQASTLAPNIHTVIRVNLTMDNANEYPKLYKFLTDKFKGKKNISIAPAFVLDRSATPAERCNSTLFSHSGRSEYILKLASQNLDSPFLRYPRPFFTECAIRNANAVSFDPEGYAYKCWESIGNKDYAVWKLNEDGMPTDINVKLLNRHIYGADPLEDPVCSKCKYLPLCGGGCPLQRIENCFEGKHNPLCTFYKGYLADFMRIHIDRKEAGIYNY